MGLRIRIVAGLAVVLLQVISCAPQAPSAPSPAAATAVPIAPPTAAAATAATALPTTALAGTPPPKAAAKPTGTLNIAVVSLYEENFLPQTGQSNRQEYRHPMFDYPFYRKHDTWELTPGLITKWGLSPDALTWTFDVRQGVKFSNGDDLTAEDIKYTFELLTSKDSQAPYAGQWRTAIKSLDVVNPYLLKVNLNDPLWGFLEDMSAGGTGNMTVVDKKYVEKVGIKEADDKPIGSGPYKLVEHKRGEYVKYEAVDEHWRVVPEFKTLVIRAVPEEATRIAMLQTGEVDMAPISASAAAAAEKSGLTLKRNPNAYTPHAVMVGPWEPTHPFYKPDVPWAKKEVREALAISINRDELVQHIYSGYAKPSAHFLLSPGSGDLKPYQYDPEKAKSLLATAGFPKGFEAKGLAFKVQPGGELPLLAEAVASYWEKIGVKINLAPMDFAAILPDIRKGATTGSIFWYANVRYADYEGPFNLFHSTTSSGRFPEWHDANLSKMLDELSKLRDPKAREDKLKAITQYNYDNYTVIPLTVVDDLFGMTKKVGSWPALEGGRNIYFEYVAPVTPAGTFRLFTP